MRAKFINNLIEGTRAFIFLSVQITDLCYRNLTRKKRGLPCYYIVGAPKCGTTALHSIISQHKAAVPLFMGLKELDFLQDIDNYNHELKGLLKFLYTILYGKYTGPDSYRKFFPSQQRIEKIRKQYNVHPICGDASPIYLYCPKAAQRIKEITPNAKIIIMLRNPIERAYSEYNMFYNNNSAEKRSFQQAVADNLNIVSTANYVMDTYIERGIYEPYIKRYLDLFNRDQIMLIKTEDFKKDTEKVVCKVFDFLGLTQISFNAPHNKLEGKYQQQMSAEIRQFLTDYYYPFNRSLYSYLGEELRWEHADATA